MHKKMTITLDEAVYDGLWRTVGKHRMSQFIEDLLRPHVLDASLDDGYKAMAADQARESEAQEWCNALAKDVTDEANRNLARVVVIPLTSNTGRTYPGEAVVSVNGQSSKAMADQIMAADKTRLKSQLSTLSKADMLGVEDAIKGHLALPR